MNSPAAGRAPRVSVIIPAYDSDATIEGCLDALAAQDYRDFEVIVVDSSPSRRCHDAVRAKYPEVRAVHNERRLLPHAARNEGAELAHGELLVHTDPDVYAEHDWLARLVAAHDEGGALVAGGVGCYGEAGFDWAVHLAKYDSWLPGAKRCEVNIAPTANLLCPRGIHREIGGFRDRWWIADTLFSWHAVERGHTLLFAPDAVVQHHHLTSLRGLLRERFERGREFGRLRIEHDDWGTGKMLYMLTVTVLPLRLAKLVGRVTRNAFAAAVAVRLVVGLPVIVVAEAAWLAGEATTYAASLRGRRDGS
jgi:GT2 family glycosyltransferase